jgi:peptidoglycan/LPS O-acetylase OafA/YrhL
MTEPLSIHAGVPPPATKKLITAGASAGNAPSSFSALSGETLTLGSSSYRPDIDGLRAVAILAVVIFHAFPGSLPGGFAGVDIFFVISGFLISRIIFKGMQQGNFSFSLFYAHRIKRILPALILVLAASYSFGWFTLVPGEFRQLGGHIAASVGFIQNFALWTEAGYFDTATEFKPLMHLWSLAIEEQFYLVYPLAIWCVWKARVNVLAFVLVLGFLSFNSNLANPAGSFFLPQARFWEIWSGSVLAYVQLFGKRQLMEHLRRWAPSLVSAGTTGLQLDHTVRSSLSVAALLLAAATVFGLDSTKNFPGWWALAPVAAAFLLIAVGPDAWVNRVILANRGMVLVGLVSYPLYLWHWPLLSFLQILEYGHPSLNTRLAAVALSFLLAWLTYRLVETPIRGGSNSRIKVGLLCMFAAAVVYAGCHTFILNGMPSRRVVEINSGISSTLLPAYKDHMDSRCGLNEEAAKKFPQCQSDDRGVAKFALLGDSKAAVLAPGVFQASTSNGYWLFMGGTNREGYALVPVVSDAAQYSPYQELTGIALDEVSANPEIEVVVFTMATRALFQLKNDDSIDDLPASKNAGLALDGLDRAVNRLVKAGKKVVITVDNPTLKEPKKCVSRATGLDFVNDSLQLVPNQPLCHIPFDRHMELSRQYREVLENLQAKYAGKLRVFDPLDLLCDMKNRVCGPSLNGVVLYRYSDHISERASVLIANKLVPFVERFAQERSGGGSPNSN